MDMHVLRPCGAIVLGLLLLVGVIRAEQDAEPLADDNPYRAAEGLSPDQLLEYIAKMLKRPDTIRARPAYVAAVVEATNRVLATEIDEPQRCQATLAQLAVLHFAACSGDTAVDRRLEELAPRYEQDTCDEVALAARQYVLEYTALNADSDDEEAVKQFLTDSEQLLSESTPGPQHARLLVLVLKATRLVADETLVRTLSRSMADHLNGCDEIEVVRLRKALAKVAESETMPPTEDLVGKPLEIEGTTLDGLDFVWNAYQGSVVLVDFWATWCGPCVREVPNIQSQYEQYHDQGFEVIGISLDRDRDALEKFLAEHQIPWVTLFEGEDTPNPVATRYGVQAIPMAILVGRDGLVISTQARGEELGRLLSEQMEAE